ncbi:Hypothetical predicted protein [Pelobates cultripes]|uniref:Uncharacterized protein n=1 Tax=Pelobates cultripes TaxID=61616 RepID=A0AAD1TA05_PELCU|nr:Hypothetical predicted protein [Pelobates cultripes]
MSDKITLMEHKLANLEDRSRSNNLRLRGVPESVTQAELPAYVRGLLRAYGLVVPPDMLQVGRAHRVPRPRHLPDTTPRDVLIRIHYFHIKEHILHESRNKSKPHEDFPTVHLFTDLSAATL